MQRYSRWSMQDGYSPALKALIHFAHQEAAESARASVDLIHLVNGYLRLHQLERLGVPFAQIIPTEQSGELPFATDSKRVMQLARELASKRGDTHVDVVHLAAGLALLKRSGDEAGN